MLVGYKNTYRFLGGGCRYSSCGIIVFGVKYRFSFVQKYDIKCQLYEQLVINRRATYEEMVSFLFECQQREGYNIVLSSTEVELRCSKVTQKVLLWASEPVQIGWRKYLYFRHDGKGGQLIIGTILYDIGREMGYKYNDAFGAFHRPLEFFYGCKGVPMCLDKKLEKI